MQNFGKMEIQNLFDSELISWLEEMAEAAYPELLQNAKATDEKRRIAENTLWEQAIKTRAQRKLGLEREELSSATVLDFERAYFVMGLMTASFKVRKSVYVTAKVESGVPCFVQDGGT